MASFLKKEENPFSLQGFSFRKLESLLAVADTGSVTAAANQKNTDVSTISRNIKELEHFFGCKLRQNSGKTAGLSPEGHELVLLLRKNLESLKDYRDRSTKSLNAVSLAAGDSLLHLIVLPKLAAIQARFNRTSVTVADMRTFEIVQALQSHSIDLGILRIGSWAEKGQGRKPSEEVLQHLELGQYRYAAFVPRRLWKNAELIESKVFELPFAMIKDHWDTNFVQVAHEGGTKISNVRVWCQTFTQVFRLVRQGYYGGILPVFCAPLMPENEFHMFEPSFMREQSHKIVLAWNRSLLDIRKTNLQPFIDYLAQELKFSSSLPSLAPARSRVADTSLKIRPVKAVSPLGQGPR